MITAQYGGKAAYHALLLQIAEQNRHVYAGASQPIVGHAAQNMLITIGLYPLCEGGVAGPDSSRVINIHDGIGCLLKAAVGQAAIGVGCFGCSRQANKKARITALAHKMHHGVDRRRLWGELQVACSTFSACARLRK